MALGEQWGSHDPMDVYRQADQVLCFGPFRIDLVRRCLMRDAEPIRLTPRLFELLLFLVQNAGRLVEKDELMQAVWGDRAVAEASLSQAVFSLRRVLRDEGAAQDFIITAPGRGYRFVDLVVPELVFPEHLASPEPEPAPAPAAAPRHMPRLWWGSAALGLLLLGLAGWRFGPGLLRPRFAPPAHSVAVLAFDNMSGDPSQAYFSDGLAEQLIDSLARVPGLQVAARTSSFSFKGSRATVQKIARTLNVAAVLEGSVRRDGDRMRVAAQLIDARTGYQYWSRTYDRPSGDILQLQGDVAEAVTGALQVSLIGPVTARLTAGETANPAAMDDYLRGMQRMRAGQDSGFTDALALFQRALALDPSFARANTGRAYALLNIAMMTADDTTGRKAFADARTAAEAAIAAAPDIATGHAALASVLDNGFLDPKGAAVEIGRAVALEPGNAAVQGNYAQIALDAGQTESGVAAGRRAAELDPLRADVWNNLADVLFEARQYTPALEALDHVRALSGTLPPRSYDLKARIEIADGSPANAARDCVQGTALIYRCLAMADHALGKPDAAQASLKKMQDAEGDPPFAMAEIYSQWGDLPAAAAALERAFREQDPALVQITADPLLDPLHQAPAYGEVRRKINFPAT